MKTQKLYALYPRTGAGIVVFIKAENEGAAIIAAHNARLLPGVAPYFVQEINAFPVQEETPEDTATLAAAADAQRLVDIASRALVAAKVAAIETDKAAALATEATARSNHNAKKK